MTRTAPGGALREGRPRPGSTLPPAARREPVLAADEVVAALPPSARRRGRLGRLLVVGLTGAGVAAWLLFASPFTTVTTVDVAGASSHWAEQVRSAAGQELGTPIVRVDTGRVADRVRAVPGVLRASVALRWPHTLVVRVVERTPAVGVRLPDGVHVFDADGVDLGVRPGARGLPLVVVPAKAVRAATVAAALRVRTSLPPSVRKQVVELGATTPDGVWFVLRGGTRVMWGSADAPAAKAAALAAMRAVAPTGHARTVDVSAPDAPAVS
jgi:cell division protein FtsQ